MSEVGSQEAKTISDIGEIAAEVGIVQSQLGDLARKLSPVSFHGPITDSPKESPVPPRPPISPVRESLLQLLLQVKDAKRCASEIIGTLDI
jgi:hypothetical protein